MLRHTYLKNQNGFSLMEMMVVVAITIVFVSLMLKLFIDVSRMADLADSKTMAYTEAQNVLEEMRQYSFGTLATDYANETFTTSSITGKGNVAISSATSTQLTATITVCWQERMGQVIGEDANLNGILDAGEDTNSNGAMDSPVQIIAYIANYD